MDEACRVQVRWLFALLCLLLPTALHAQNLIANGDFEADRADWTGGALSANAPHGGQACLEVVDASTTDSVSALSSLVALPNRGPYRFSVSARTDVTTQVVLVVLNQYRADGSWISGANIELPLTVGTAWIERSFLIRNLHAETTQLQVTLLPVYWTAAGERTGRAFFDDIALEPVVDVDVVRGAWLGAAGGPIWLPPSEQKVRPHDVLPAEAPVVSSLRMEAAMGEWESAQVALRLLKDDQLIAMRVSDLAAVPTVPTAPAIIRAAQVEVREVAYVTVTRPTDFASYSGEMPDPLPKLALPLTVAAGRQQSLWLTLHVPDDAKPGTYRGMLELTFATAGAMTIPLEVRVWNFRLGRERQLRTSYLLSLEWIDRYHHLGGDPGRRKATFRAYLQDFADHGISPMDITGDDAYWIRHNLGWPLDAIVADPTTPSGPAGPAETNRVVKVTDNDATTAIAIVSQDVITVERGKSYVVSWRAYSDDAHDYTVALMQYDADGNWIPGRNIDLTRSSQALWQTESVTLDAARFVGATIHLHLYARPWTETGELQGTTFFDDLSFHQAPTGAEQVVNGDLRTTTMDAELTLDFSRFDEAAAFALDTLKMNSFHAPLPLFAVGTFEAQQKPDLLGYAWGTPEYEARYIEILQTLEAHLSQKGWLGKAYAYWFDEPEPQDHAFVKQGMSLIRRGAPGLLRLLTEEYDTTLAGDVDIWAPLLDHYDERWAHDRQTLGEQVWWYVCTIPRAPYANNFIDHPALEYRLRFWMAWKWNVQGDLFWLTNYWTNDKKFPPPNLQDPWTDPMSYSLDAAGRVDVWGNGDGRLLYPPRSWKDGQTRVEGPTPSIRWELIREGIDDYEYLWRLRSGMERMRALHLPANDALLAQGTKLLELPDWLIKSRETYTSDLAALPAYRREVAATLEAVEAALLPVESPAGKDASLGGGCSLSRARSAPERLPCGLLIIPLLLSGLAISAALRRQRGEGGRFSHFELSKNLAFPSTGSSRSP